MVMSGQLQAPGVLPQAQCPVTRWIRVWMGPRADLDLLEERKAFVGAAIRTPDSQNMEHLRQDWRRSHFVTRSRFMKCGKVLTPPRPFTALSLQTLPSHRKLQQQDGSYTYIYIYIYTHI